MNVPVLYLVPKFKKQTEAKKVIFPNILLVFLFFSIKYFSGVFTLNILLFNIYIIIKRIIISGIDTEKINFLIFIYSYNL